MHISFERIFQKKYLKIFITSEENYLKTCSHVLIASNKVELSTKLVFIH